MSGDIESVSSEHVENVGPLVSVRNPCTDRQVDGRCSRSSRRDRRVQGREWKEPIGRLGLVGQGVVATIIGLLAIRIAMGEKDEAATSEGAVAWLADQPLREVPARRPDSGAVRPRTLALPVRSDGRSGRGQRTEGSTEVRRARRRLPLARDHHPRRHDRQLDRIGRHSGQRAVRRRGFSAGGLDVVRLAWRDGGSSASSVSP